MPANKSRLEPYTDSIEKANGKIWRGKIASNAAGGGEINMATQEVEALGIWAEDPRSVEGAMALAQMPRVTPATETNGSFKDSLVPDLDPRVVATKAEQAYRQSSFGHVETVVKSTHVPKDIVGRQEYSMK